MSKCSHEFDPEVELAGEKLQALIRKAREIKSSNLELKTAGVEDTRITTLALIKHLITLMEMELRYKELEAKLNNR